MVRRLLLLCLIAACSCTYDPAFGDLTCENEGEVDGNRRCSGGVWVTDSDAEGVPDASGEDASGGTDADITPDMVPGVDAGPDGSCTPETNDAFCARFGATCDDLTEFDTCGNQRTVNCGTCMAPATCGGGGTANVCACPDQTDIEFCAAHQKTCGVYTGEDVCGQMRTVTCGSCSGLLTCSATNVCECQPGPACMMLGKNCGMVSVNGQCGATTSVECGTCGANATCGAAVDNVCGCDSGYETSAGTCVDVDECAAGTDDCDTNADCTNTPGSFTCRCQQGYVGNGKQCMPAPAALVDSVTRLQIVLTDGEGMQTVTLPAAVDRNRTVPFVTRRGTASSDLDRLGIDVFLPQNDRLTVSRENSSNGMTIVVYLVEFNAQAATVQSGQFQFTNTSTSVQLPSAVARDKSFLVFFHTNDSNTDVKRNFYVSGEISQAGDQLQFERDDNTGTISGHWWVVESIGTQFSVQHATTSMNGTNQAMQQIQGVLTPKVLLLYSYTSDHNDNDSDRSNVGCALTSTTQVACERFSSSNNIPEIALQVVSFNTTPFVHRGSETFNTGQDSRTITLPMAVGQDAMAFGGHLGVAGANPIATTSGSESGAAFFTQQIVNNGDQVELQRDGAPARAIVRWQVVDW